jgi:ribonuclease-3
VFEAITGAIFQDGGLEAATCFVCHALGEELAGADPLTAANADYKTMLQEKLQAERRPAPRYTVIETLGPPHQRIFHVEVSWDRGSIQGEGHSIKVAEAAAARAALEGMKSQESEIALVESAESATEEHT